MTYKEIREEIVARGFDDFEQSDARIKRWTNQAYLELCEEYPWPFLLATTKEGTAPLTIEDLGHVLSVANKTNENQLAYATLQELIGFDPNLDDSGPAARWYRDEETKVKVWPADTSSTFAVRYLKVPAELSEDSDKPLIPTRYQDLIVDGAVIRLYKNRDNLEAAQTVRQEWERGVYRMLRTLLRPNYDGPRFAQRTGYPYDYL